MSKTAKEWFVVTQRYSWLDLATLLSLLHFVAISNSLSRQKCQITLLYHSITACNSFSLYDQIFNLSRLVSMISGIKSTSIKESESLRVLRAVRVLRPLKIVSGIPSKFPYKFAFDMKVTVKRIKCTQRIRQGCQAYDERTNQLLLIRSLGPVQWSNFICAEPNTNGQKLLLSLICFGLGTW